MRVRILLALAVGASLLGFAGLRSPADAAGLRACNGAGQIYFAQNPDGSADLTAAGGGACTLVVGSRLKIVNLVGTGHADSIGLCSGSPVVRNLVMDVTVTATDPFTNTSEVEHYTWSAPVSTFPLATPVIITGDNIGASLTLSHIFLNCGQDGRRPTANFNWLQTT